MIPISSDPLVNREYIEDVYEGFGVEPVLAHAPEKYKQKIFNQVMKQSSSSDPQMNRE